MAVMFADLVAPTLQILFIRLRVSDSVFLFVGEMGTRSCEGVVETGFM